jgi:hypothetical protein
MFYKTLKTEKNKYRTTRTPQILGVNARILFNHFVLIFLSKLCIFQLHTYMYFFLFLCLYVFLRKQILEAFPCF